MAKPCLYLNIYDTGISAALGTAGSIGPFSVIDYDTLSGEDEAHTSSLFQRALAHLFEEDRLSGCDHALVTIPSSWVWFRHNSFPFNHKKKIEKVLSFELKSSYPFPETETLLDFHILNLQFKKDQSLVLSGSLAEERVEEIFSGLASRKISPKMMIPRGCTHAMALLADQRKLTNILHVHMAPEETTLTLIIDRQPLVIRSLAGFIKGPDGSQIDYPALVEAVHRTLAGADIRAGLNKKVFTALDIKFSVPGNCQVIQEQIHKAVASANHDIRFAGAMETQEMELWPKNLNLSLPFMFNFCVGRYRADSFFGRHKNRLLTLTCLVFMIFSLNLAHLHRQTVVLKENISQVHQEAVAVYEKTFPRPHRKPIQAPLLFMESKVKKAREGKTNSAEDIAWRANNHTGILKILSDLSSRIPPPIDMEITRLGFNNNRLVITGSTTNFNDVDKIKSLMEKAPGFKTVNINSAKSDKTGHHVRFKFIVEL